MLEPFKLHQRLDFIYIDIVANKAYKVYIFFELREVVQLCRCIYQFVATLPFGGALLMSR